METVTIDETTVEIVGGVRVPMGSMTQGSYELPDGRTERGWICALALPDRAGVFVGLGSVVAVGDGRWEVVGIQKQPGKLGSVTLQRL